MAPRTPPGQRLRAWKPDVPGIAEVLHARFTEHAYPLHTHDTWTLLIVDDGTVRYDLDHHQHAAQRSQVTLLPPHVPHDGTAATPDGFGKRVLYLDAGLLGSGLIGAAVDRPALPDAALRQRIHRLHRALAQPGEELAAESRLALIAERLRNQLGRSASTAPPAHEPGLAERLRELIDSRVPEGITLTEAAALFEVHPSYLVRVFGRRYGIPPHRYLTGRRLDLARRLLLAGLPAAHTAQAAGFYDQAHLNRHFRTLLGTSPARYAAGLGGP